MLVFLFLVGCKLETKLTGDFSKNPSSLPGDVPDAPQAPAEPLTISLSSDGSGSNLSNFDLDLFENLEIYAFYQSAPDEKINVPVSWILDGSIGNLNIQSGGKSAVFTASQSGSGQISVSYQGHTQIIQVTVNVNSPPTAGNQKAIVEVNSLGQDINLLVNASDPNGDTVVVETVNAPSHGQFVDQGNNVYKYIPDASYVGPDAITFVVNDGKGETANGEILFYVASPLTWTGAAGSGVWSDTENWCGSVVAGACTGGVKPNSSSDVYIFSICENNCDIQVDESVDVTSIQVLADYEGQITQNSGRTITATSYSQKSGSFVGGDSEIRINGNFILGGDAQFQSTTHRLFQYSSCKTSNFNVENGASFNHNNSLVEFYVYANYCGAEIKVNLGQETSFYNVIFRTNGHYSYTLNLDILGQPLNVVNSYQQLGSDAGSNAGLKTGRIKIQKDFHMEYSSGGNGQIEFIGAANQEYSALGARAPFVIVNKPSGTLSPAAGTSSVEAEGLVVSSGTFVAPTGTLTVGGFCRNSSFTVSPSAQFQHNNGTLRIRSYTSYCASSSSIDVDGSLDLNNLIITADGYHANSSSWTLQSGDELNVLGNFAYGSAGSASKIYLYGSTINVEGDVDIYDTARNGSTLINLTGSNQVFRLNGGIMPGPFAINSSGTVQAGTHLSFNSSSLTLQSGIFDLMGFSASNINSLSLYGTSSVNLNGGSISYVSCGAGSCP
ncbi:MAG: cadherin-like domain-containing protein [Bdellovibrionales bacterium]|nr:cadherin-like domain-containing protein [Bdellovibrionales bacterium]